MSNAKNISVVMATYKNDICLQIREAIESIVNQSLKVDEFIIVIDGEIPQKNDVLLQGYSKKYSIKLLYLKENMGPGAARNYGVSAARNELIAIMDADDISRENRVEMQYSEFCNYEVDVVGGYINEFFETASQPSRRRIVPTNHDDILKYARKRSPVNNVTLMFKKSIFERVGGYSETTYMEDYDLVIRLLEHGAIFRNLPEVLVDVRVDADLFLRRGGFTLAKRELHFFIHHWKNGFFSTENMVFGILTRLPIRLIPSHLRAFIYSHLLR